MFGDYFGQRADYSSGLFYSCHRMYLNEDGSSSLDAPEQFKTRKTVRNLRLTEKEEINQYGAAGRRLSQCPVPVKLKLGGKAIEEHSRRFRNVANMVVGAVALEQGGAEFRSRDDWIQKCEAGVKIWVNVRTGEVTTDSPLQENNSYNMNSNRSSMNGTFSINNSRRSSGIPLARRISMQNRRSEDYSNSPIRNRSPTKKTIMRTRSKSLDDLGSPVDLGLGTASLLYDPEPVEELFKLLDQMQTKQKK